MSKSCLRKHPYLPENTPKINEGRKRPVKMGGIFCGEKWGLGCVLGCLARCGMQVVPCRFPAIYKGSGVVVLERGREQSSRGGPSGAGWNSCALSTASDGFFIEIC
jgi:hypothetical protein